MALQSLEQLLAFIEAEIAAGRDPFGAGTPLGVQPGLPPPLDDDGNPVPLERGDANNSFNASQDLVQMLGDPMAAAIFGGNVNPEAFEPIASYEPFDMTPLNSYNQALGSGDPGDLGSFIADLINDGHSPSKAFGLVMDVINGDPDGLGGEFLGQLPPNITIDNMGNQVQSEFPNYQEILDIAEGFSEAKAQLPAGYTDPATGRSTTPGEINPETKLPYGLVRDPATGQPSTATYADSPATAMLRDAGFSTLPSDQYTIEDLLNETEGGDAIAQRQANLSGVPAAEAAQASAEELLLGYREAFGNYQQPHNSHPPSYEQLGPPAPPSPGRAEGGGYPLDELSRTPGSGVLGALDEGVPGPQEIINFILADAQAGGDRLNAAPGGIDSAVPGPGDILGWLNDNIPGPSDITGALRGPGRLQMPDPSGAALQTSGPRGGGPQLEQDSSDPIGNAFRWLLADAEAGGNRLNEFLGSGEGPIGLPSDAQWKNSLSTIPVLGSIVGDRGDPWYADDIARAQGDKPTTKKRKTGDVPSRGKIGGMLGTPLGSPSGVYDALKKNYNDAIRASDHSKKGAWQARTAKSMQEYRDRPYQNILNSMQQGGHTPFLDEVANRRAGLYGAGVFG